MFVGFKFFYFFEYMGFEVVMFFVFFIVIYNGFQMFGKLQVWGWVRLIFVQYFIIISIIVSFVFKEMVFFFIVGCCFI